MATAASTFDDCILQQSRAELAVEQSHVLSPTELWVPAKGFMMKQLTHVQKDPKIEKFPS